MNFTHGKGQNQSSKAISLTISLLDAHLPTMLTRKQIELGAKLYIVLHLIFFAIYTFGVCQMMGFFGGK
ncbi:hypothetical protein N9A94_05970 [Akkermansiaceae bacterium]|nr:hypothetical protein [Akkermansiaceae bacterium]